MNPPLGRQLGQGRSSAIHPWRDGGTARVYQPGIAKQVVLLEAAIQAAAEAEGLPVPAVRGVQEMDGRWVLITEGQHSRSLADVLRQTGPDGQRVTLGLLAELQAGITSRPAPAWLGRLKPRLSHAILRGPLPAAARNELLERLSLLPDGDRFCHGDLHPANVLMAEHGSLLAVDWPHAAAGHPSADCAQTMLLLLLRLPELAQHWLAAAAEANELAERRILAWLPVLAAARLEQAQAGEAALLQRIVVQAQ